MSNDQRPTTTTTATVLGSFAVAGVLVVIALATLSAQVPSSSTSSSSDPFEFFRPQVNVTASERSRLDRGETIVRSAGAVDGQVAIFSATKTSVSGDRLVRWVHRVDLMKRGKYVPAVVRFSDPPRLSDVDKAELDADDLDALRRCRPGDCGLKLSEPEIAQLAPLARARRSDGAAVQQAFRAALFARTQQYLATGFTGTLPYRDQDEPVDLAAEFSGLLAQAGFLPQRLPQLTNFLVRYPTAPEPAAESFLYWSKEILGRKPVISITHVTLMRPEGGPDAVVLSRQVYATHYVSGSLAITAIVGGRDAGTHYLAYLNRSRVDVLDGFFGGLVRRIVERRLRDEAGTVVDALRKRIEGGEPE